MFGYLVGWFDLFCWLVGWLVGWMVGWLDGWMVGYSNWLTNYCIGHILLLVGIFLNCELFIVIMIYPGFKWRQCMYQV
jgi:organic anion transporter 5A